MYWLFRQSCSRLKILTPPSMSTGKSLSEALIFASTNPRYDNRLFMKKVSSEYLQNMLCTQIVVFVLFWHSKQFWYTTCSADIASFWKRCICNIYCGRRQKGTLRMAALWILLFYPVRNSLWLKKKRASDNEGKFHSFLMCRIWIYSQKLIS